MNWLAPFFVFSISFAWADMWTWQNPLPQGNYLNAIHFPTVDTGYMAGYGGTVIKTTDGGKSWTTRSFNETCLFFGIHFSGTRDGIAVGTGLDYNTQKSVACVYATHDGGASWIPAPVLPEHPFTEAVMLSPKDIVIVGKGGKLQYSSDGGQSWAPVTSPPASDSRDMEFFSPDSGYILSSNNLFRTTDRGVSWKSDTLPQGFEAWALGRARSGRIFAGGSYKPTGAGAAQIRIYRSVNGGTDWNQTSVPSTVVGNIKSIRFVNELIGYASGRGGLLLRSADRGETWSLIHEGSTEDLNLASFFAMPDVGYDCGFGGVIRKTTDGGATWAILSKGTGISSTLNDIHFPTGRIGYTVGFSWYRKHAVLLKTMDAGSKWDSIKTVPDAVFKSVHFADARNGFMVGEAGAIAKTEDGGASWSKIGHDSLVTLDVVRMLDAKTILTAGDSGIERSFDAGLHWTKVWSGTEARLNAMTVSMEGILFASGKATANGTDHGIILRSRNGGADWETIELKSAEMHSLSFPSGKIGFAGGGFGQFYRTTDGGDSWQKMGKVFDSRVVSVNFLDKDTGYVSLARSIFRTTDGGLNWSRLTSGSANNLGPMVFADRWNAFAVGEWGTILKLTRDGTSGLPRKAKAPTIGYPMILAGKILLPERDGNYDFKGRFMNFRLSPRK